MNSHLEEENQGSQLDVNFIPYDLLEESKQIGEGSWGIECIFKPTNKRRALKLLPSKPKKWFTTELASSFLLKHENIIKIYGRTCVGVVNGIITERVDGKSLKEVIHDKSISYTLADILLWNIQAFRALEYVIDFFRESENEPFRRYFNRIASAENMILNPAQDVLKICALGLLKDIPDPKDSSETNYSYYWAPEVWNGEYRYEESDVYPFSVVLWECLTRVEPVVFPQSKKLSLDPVDYGNYVDASPMFEQFIDRCTIREPSKDRLPVSVIKSILENMIPVGKRQNFDLFKDDVISFWNANELYYCNKLISIKLTPKKYAKKQVKQVSKIFHYKSLENMKVLGSGAFGKVCSAEYEGKQIAVKFQLAMKMMPFLQEFSVLSNLEHENIVKVIGQIQEDGVYGVVMEFIDGTSLNQIIYETPKNYSLGDVLTWNYQAASALEYMHSFRLLHRDVKPDNMLIENSQKRTLKIVDLGGAKKLLSERDLEPIQDSLSFTAMGTELYMAPEVDNKDHYNEQCDVYSWTITFWECLTAEKPQRPPDYRSKANQICSTKLVEIIEKCSSSKPSDRKSIFVIKKWLGDMLKNRKAFTDTDLTFRENCICVWNKQTNELYCLAKAESEKRLNDVLTKAKTSFVMVPIDGLKIIEDLADHSGNVKLVEVDPIPLGYCRIYLNEIRNSFIRMNDSIDGAVYDQDEELKMLEEWRKLSNREHDCIKCRIFEYNKQKVLKFSKHANEKYQENEFLILSKLKHENVIQLFGYTYDNELSYFGIITEFSDYSKTLEKIIAAGHYDTKDILKWGLQSARGLEYMHSRNILHCDIKPANIVASFILPLKICDFSLSRDLEYSHPNEAIGTGIYMAPEVRPDGILTKKSDVYSWTVTFWELCICQNVSPTHAMFRILENIRQMESIDLCKAGNGYKIVNGSDKFNEFIQTCANADPDKRWTFADIATLLENMLNSNSSYVPDFANIEVDMVVKDNICLWCKSNWWKFEIEKVFFYASADYLIKI